MRTTSDCAAGRFFAPESVIWRVDRETALLLGGGRALLMQVAHPKVAAGVAEHSRFKADPIGRLVETMNAIWSIVFDEIPQAQASLRRIERVHQRVRGTIRDGDIAPGGASYRAQDPDLMLWVHATLVDSALATYELLVAPLTLQERRQYYDETKKLAVLMGIPHSIVLPTLDAFADYLEKEMRSGSVSVGPAAREIAREILHPRPWWLKIFAPLLVLMTTGLLPPRLRRSYDLAWTKRRERIFRLLAAAARRLLPFVPALFRVVPHARRAERNAPPAFKIEAKCAH